MGVNFSLSSCQNSKVTSAYTPDPRARQKRDRASYFSSESVNLNSIHASSIDGLSSAEGQFWKIFWTRSPTRPQSIHRSPFRHLLCFEGSNLFPLQLSCAEVDDEAKRIVCCRQV